jgi:K+-sensing histidine kinase KdpD
MKELSLHVLDIVQNSIVAGASSVDISIREDFVADSMSIIIADNGKGIPAEMLQKVTDPYTTSRTTRKVGMGLPLLQDACRSSGGSLKIESVEGKGTAVTVTLGLSHIDRQPLGDIAGVVVLLVSANPKIEFRYTHQRNDEEYVFDTQEVRETLDGMPLNSPDIMKILREMILLNLEEL